ncbi:MAG: VWA domain-containing protein, partial [archaeon]|nr:VWA domain-containing protein [archaeon]
MNKWISLAVLVLTVFSFSVVCQDTSSASVPTDYTDISEGQTVSVTVASERYFRFMPADTGYYRYSSSGSGSPQGAVLDFSGEVLYSNDDIGYNENFGMVVPMKGGSVYYLRSEAFGEESGGYSVKIAKVDMTPTPIGVSGTYGLYDSGNGSDDYLFPVSSGDVNNMSSTSGYDINVGSGDIVPVGSPFTLSHVLLSDMGVSVGCTGFGDALLSLDDLTSGYRIVLGPLGVRSVPAYHFIVGHVYVFTVEAMSEPLGLRSLTVRADLFTDEVPGHHPASSTVHPPTCTEDGYVDIFSSGSDAPVLKVVLPALGHDYIRDGLEYHCSHDGSHDFKVTLTTEGSGRLDYEGVPYGEVIEVTAVPSEGYVFEGWYLDGCLVSDTPVLNLKISMSTEYTAVFVPMVLVRGASIFIGHVVMGTPFDEIELPSTVLCTRSDGSSVPVTVQWASDGYDPGAIGGFSLHAAIPSPYVVLGAEVVAYGDVIWHVPDPIAIAFIEVPSVVIEFGDRFAHPCVYGVSEDLRIPMAVKWDVRGFDPTDVRTVSLSGTVTVPYGYVLGDGVSGNVSMDVTVVPREITSFNGPELGVFPEDSTVENLGLPSSVGVTVTNGTVYLPVSWDVSGFSSDRGEHSIPGTVTVPYGYELSPGIDASVEAHYTVSSVVSDIADIVFVVDTTGSMVQEIKNVRKNISAFVSGLSDDGISARLALVEYKDITFDGRDSTKVVMGPDGAWFTDPSMFAENIDQLKVDGGGDHPETVIDALEAVRSLEFRPGAYRFVVLVTDDTFKTDNTRGVRSMSEEIS